MEFFETTKKILAMCLFRPNQTRIYDTKRLVVSLLSLLVVASFFAFLFHGADSMEDYVNSAYFCTTSFGIFLSFLHTTTETESIFALININESIETRFKYSASKALYVQANRLVEKFSKIMYTVIVNVTVPCFVIPKAILCFFYYFTTAAGSEAFELPLPMWFPFDYKNPYGFLLAISIQLVVVFHASRYLACFLTMAFGWFMFALSFLNDMIAEIRSINKCAKAKKSEKSIRKRLIELVTMHCKIRQLSEEHLNHFTEVYQPTIAILFSGSIVAICAAMLLFQVNISSDEISTVVILVSFVYGFWALIMLAFACEVGQRLSFQFAKFSDEISQSNWTYLPMKLQKWLPTIMVDAQQSFEVKCFGSVTANRETFKMIINRGYTCFMMLHKLY